LSLTQKSDSLAKLYEMDENPERRLFLDKLLGYMDEIRKPVTACPTISKQPLDLYRLYLYVKERGGFMEVCKVNFANRTHLDLNRAHQLLSSINKYKIPSGSPLLFASHRLPKARLGKTSPAF
jgi:ARID/BRIGHT DNA binding domain